MIEPEAAPPAPPDRRHRRAVVAGVTLLAVVAGGLAGAFNGDGPEAKPLALLAGNGTAGGAETMAALDTKMPGAPASGAPDASRRSSAPYGGWGLTFEVEGDLPDLPDHAAAWRVNTPGLDRAALARIAEALGVQGTPVERDGGWFVENGDWTLSAYGGDAMGKGGAWYVNLYRRSDGRTDDTPAGPAVSRSDAERRVLDLLDRMGAPRAAWKIETTDTEIGVGWACAVPELTAEEAEWTEAEHLRRVERENVASSAGASAPNGTTVVDPAPPTESGSGRASGAGTSGSAGAVAGTTPADTSGPSCPPPPPPVKGFNVALFPLLDGRRADWPVWNVTMRSDGRIENLYGSWVSFEQGDDYKLRGVRAALKDLQSPPVAYATDGPAPAIEPAPPLAVQQAGGTVEATGAAEGSAGAGVAGSSGAAAVPAVDLPAGAPVCPPLPMPLPARDDADWAVASMPADCAPQAPQVVRITGVELGLIQTAVFEDGQARLAMVPSYRFTGHFDNGTPWETSVLALHPDAIAPPPDFPVGDGARRDGGGADFGKAVPPTPTPGPAIAPDDFSR